MDSTRGQKAAHVRAAKQTRSHHCHWPDCPEQVPPASWGCRAHWFTLPKNIRDRIWDAYRPGQEKTMSPSGQYLDAADAAQKWIAARSAPRAQAAKPAPSSAVTPPLEDSVASHLASIAIHLATSKTDVGVQLARVREEWSERAAIREYLGGIPRWQAERAAVDDAGIALGAIAW